MRLLGFTIRGLRLHEHQNATMTLYATDAVRTPIGTHPLPGAARNINTHTVIGIAGINASGKTTALRILELALTATSGASLGTADADLFPLYATMAPTITIHAVLEHDGRFHMADSELENTGQRRTPLRFVRETLRIHHGKLSKTALAKALDGEPDETWTIEATRNIGRPGKDGELSADARRYLPADRSICGAITGDGVPIDTDLLPVAPTLDPSPAPEVTALFDATIERLDRDADGIHLKFHGEARARDVTPASLVSLVSSGTLRGGSLMSRALETLRTGGYMLVDELENSINKQLVFVLMDLFAAPDTNPHGAVLAFSTHYPELLDHFTRKDDIWFAVRSDDGLALRDLGKHQDRADLRKSVSFFANRIPGTAPSYAAIRALQDYARGLADA